MDGITKGRLKEIKSLQQKKFRDETGFFVIEGVKMVEETMAAIPHLIDCCLHTSEYQISNQNQPFPIYQVDRKSLEQCSSLKTPNKILAVVKQLPQKNANSKFILALDGIQDPGNMGTILRLADWFGIEQIVCSKETVDCYNPKVVQASMGAILRVSINYCSLKTFLSETKLPVFGALLEGKNIYKESLTNDGILLMGNEGNGISNELLSYIQHPLTIPRFGKAESLNVSVATGILLSEFWRGVI